jgi:integrase
MIWMALGLGFGQQDLATILVGQIDRKAYDLRRSKTGIERYGSTPPLVWAHLKRYVAEFSRSRGEPLFVTRLGRPLVHDRADSVTQWWSRLRKSLGETKRTLGGFYTLRHLGATEYGSRSGCSIADIRRWLGHSASSQMADVYMRPIPPEYREVVTWVRKRLTSKVLTERSKQR